MIPDRDPESFLGPYRVLDLTNEKGLLAGKLMGDLGADVIKIEPPDGDPSRNIGPFYNDMPDPNKSLYWWAFNLNKRGVTLNLETEDGRELFRRLVETADFVVESYAPGTMERLGLGYDELSKINPRLVMASISPFGQTGPYSKWQSTDLINMALGGFMYVTGDEDRSPVRFSFPISYSHAGAEAATAMMLAHNHRENTGEGQYVDVSIQQCVVWTLMNTTVTWDLLHLDVMRGAGARANPVTGVRTRSIWPCADGYVTFGITGGAARADGMRYLTNMMMRDGMASEHLQSFDWLNFDARSMTQEQYNVLEREMGAFLLTKTMNELYDAAVKGRILLAPVTTPREIVESPQLKYRDYFIEVDHPELGRSITYPNAFVKMSAWAPRISRRAPLIGEHNAEILGGELGLTTEQLTILKQAGAI